MRLEIGHEPGYGEAHAPLEQVDVRLEIGERDEQLVDLRLIGAASSNRIFVPKND